MARVPIPLVINADVFVAGNAQTIATMQVGSLLWYQWLTNEKNVSFAFQSQKQLFTARRERQRHGWYWYAYRKHQNKIYKSYLGKSEQLTLAHLQEVAQYLARKVDAASQAGSAMQPSRKPQLKLPATTLPLSTSQFAVPPLPAANISRSHLLARLNSGRQAKLILLSATAGWGKTSLLSAWCKQLAQTQTAFIWMSLTAQDSNPISFWSKIIHACQVHKQGLGRTALTLLQHGQASMDMVISSLTQDLAQLSEHLFLILDDCHHLPAAYRQALTSFVEQLPPSIHLVLAGRTNPPLSMAKLRVQGQLLEIRTQDLAFTTQEVYTLLVETLHLPVSLEICTLLRERTEGWAAGIYLAAFNGSTSEENRPGDAIVHFDGGNRYVVDYVQEEILFALSPELQNFLFQTSILKHMQQEICAILPCGEGSQGKIDELLRLNLCIAETRQNTVQYRYHHFLRDALRTRFRQDDAALELGLHQQAMVWYEEQTRFSDAIYHARALGDEHSIARLLKKKEQSQARASEVTIEAVTERERDVLTLLVEGASNREIAQKLIISEGTVKKHVSNICSKLGVHRRIQVITRALASYQIN